MSVFHACKSAFECMYQIKVVHFSANRTTRQPERIGYRAIKLTDNLIDPFLPAGVAVSPSPNGRVKLPQSHFRNLNKPLWHLVHITFVIVHVQYAVKLCITTHPQLILSGQAWCTIPGESLTDSLSCKTLHLDVEELSEVTEPFNHLGGHTAVKLDVGEVCLECIGAWIAGVEEHELGFLQVAGGQALLGSSCS